MSYYTSRFEQPVWFTFCVSSCHKYSFIFFFTAAFNFLFHFFSLTMITVKLRKPWEAEKFQECWLCSDQSQWSSGHASKPQTNYCCCLWFRFLTPYWLALLNTITLHEYFWCSRFCEFHSKMVISYMMIFHIALPLIFATQAISIQLGF